MLVLWCTFEKRRVHGGLQGGRWTLACLSGQGFAVAAWAGVAM